MLAYAAHRRRATERRPAPHAMLVILVAHIAAIAAVMSAKMSIPDKVPRTRTEVELIKVPPPPPPPDVPQPQPRPQTQPSTLDQVRVIVPTPRPPDLPIDSRPVPMPIPGGEIVGPAINPVPQPRPLPPVQPVRVGPRFATPASALRPPYPASKIASEEEAVLKLRLAIDERGRITGVSPVGSADPAFLEAARRHLIARWRYKPATEDGRPVASTTVITLRFELEG